MKKVFLSILVAAAFTACSNNEIPETNYVASDVPINLVAGTLNASLRSTYGDIPAGTQKALTARVIGSLSQTDFTSGAAVVTNADGAITFQAMNPTDYTLASAQAFKQGFPTPAFYPLNAATPVYLAGLHPSTGWTSSAAAAFDFAIDGHSDVMSAPVVSTTKTDATSVPTTFRNLAFKHELTLLNINVVAATTAAINYWGSVQAISLTALKGATPLSAITVSLGTVNSSALGGTAAILPTYIAGSDNPFTGQSTALTTTPAAVSYVIAPYFTVTSGDNANACTLNVTTANGGTLSVPVTINANSTGSTASRAYDITLTFKATEIMATATVAPWVAGGTGSGTLE